MQSDLTSKDHTFTVLFRNGVSKFLGCISTEFCPTISLASKLTVLLDVHIGLHIIHSVVCWILRDLGLVASEELVDDLRLFFG